MSTETREIPRAARPQRRVRRRRRGGRLYRLSLDQYQQMVEAGILKSGTPIVLLDGLLVTKMTKGNPHETAAYLGQEVLRATLPPGWLVRKESPLALPGGPGVGDSAPEPDISVVRGVIRDYATRTPGPGDVALVIEVADSSVSNDRKGLIRYARAGIPFAWIVNLPSRTLEVSSRPTGPGPDPRYAESRTYGDQESVPVVIDGREVAQIRVADLLP